MSLGLLARVVVFVAAVALAACGGGAVRPSALPPAPAASASAARPVLPAAYRPSGLAAAGHTFVHLFEWRWTDVARECETVLGPAGYRAVQVSPPQEHMTGAPWWIRYQPVSYSIERSRSGSGAEFREMVQRCQAADVDIYVDAVINHMTAQEQGVGTNGTAYTKYEYPGLYSRADFHAPCLITTYQSAANVQDCELVGLADLDTGSPSVRARIADYLVRLTRLGVAGFRIDAAKHMQPVELDAIVDLVNEAAVAEGRSRPYWFAEVIDHGGEAIGSADYLGLGYGSGGAVDITEFKYRRAGDAFLGAAGRRLAQLNPAGASGGRFAPETSGMLPADKAVVFLENHDTQRGEGIGYRDGQAYRLANVWMLAHPYGYPQLMSSYALDRESQAGRDAGPPSSMANETTPVRCAASLETATIGEWVCEHRDPYISRMVGFRRAVAGTPLTRWWDNGANAIAFSRGDKGFVAINGEGAPLAATIATGLAPGRYCDVLGGGRRGTTCGGDTIVVQADGRVTLTLPANSALAIDTTTRL